MRPRAHTPTRLRLWHIDRPSFLRALNSQLNEQNHVGRLMPLDSLLGAFANRRVQVPVQRAIVAPQVLDPLFIYFYQTFSP